MSIYEVKIILHPVEKDDEPRLIHTERDIVGVTAAQAERIALVRWAEEAQKEGSSRIDQKVIEKLEVLSRPFV